MNFSSEYILFAKTLVGVIAIVNPLGAIPVFLSLCGDRAPQECHKIARLSAISVVVILVLSIWIGEPLLHFFGISLPAFRVGGGLLILLMAVAMMQAKHSAARQRPEEVDEADDKDNIAVVPLAIPLMAGPGAISLLIIDSHQLGSWGDHLYLTMGMFVVGVVVFLSLRLATPIGERLGVTGLNIATRVMGLLLSAIGVQMIAGGLVKLMPGLG
ncbi:MAG: MarC family protein [bacterium]